MGVLKNVLVFVSLCLFCEKGEKRERGGEILAGMMCFSLHSKNNVVGLFWGRGGYGRSAYCCDANCEGGGVGALGYVLVDLDYASYSRYWRDLLGYLLSHALGRGSLTWEL